MRCDVPLVTATAAPPLVVTESAAARRMRSFQRWGVDQLMFCYRYGEIYPKVSALWKPLLFARLKAGDDEGFRGLYNGMLAVSGNHASPSSCFVPCWIVVSSCVEVQVTIVPRPGLCERWCDH